jgi:hypothetical protein
VESFAVTNENEEFEILSYSFRVPEKKKFHVNNEMRTQCTAILRFAWL